MKVALCGCMMQEPGTIEKIRKSYRFVDLVFGTHNIFKFAELLASVFEQKAMIVDIWEGTDKIVEDLRYKENILSSPGSTSCLAVIISAATVSFPM